MSSFRRLFSSRDLGQDVSFSETPLDHFVRFSLQGAFRRAEPSPAVWKRIEHRLERDQLPPGRSFLLRFLNRWPQQMSHTMHLFFSDSSLHERLDERKMELFTQILTFPGPNAMGLAVA